MTVGRNLDRISLEVGIKWSVAMITASATLQILLMRAAVKKDTSPKRDQMTFHETKFRTSPKHVCGVIHDLSSIGTTLTVK